METVIKSIIVCLVVLFLLVIAAIVMAALALGNKSSSGNIGFKVVKVTSTGSTSVTVKNPTYVQAMVTGSTGTATINFTGQNGSIALVRNSGSTVPVVLTSDLDMYTLSNRDGANSYTLKTNTYALLIWEKGNIYIAPFL